MSLVVKHPTRNRLYALRFDHAEAQRRYAAGEKVKDLAVEYGVTPDAVYKALKAPEKREHWNATSKKWRTGACENCGGPAMRLVSGKRAHNPDGRVLCLKCRGVEKRESVQFDKEGKLISVRCEMLDCANGERWQPPSNFPRGGRFPDLREGGFHGQCRACNTRARREYRHSRYVPCEICGTPTSPTGKEGRRQPRALCHPCAISRVLVDG